MYSWHVQQPVYSSATVFTEDFIRALRELGFDYTTVSRADPLDGRTRVVPGECVIKHRSQSAITLLMLKNVVIDRGLTIRAIDYRLGWPQ